MTGTPSICDSIGDAALLCFSSSKLLRLQRGTVGFTVGRFKVEALVLVLGLGCGFRVTKFDGLCHPALGSARDLHSGGVRCAVLTCRRDEAGE